MARGGQGLKGRTYTPEQKAEVRRLYAELDPSTSQRKYSQRQIAEKLNIPRQTVGLWLAPPKQPRPAGGVEESAPSDPLEEGALHNLEEERGKRRAPRAPGGARVQAQPAPEPILDYGAIQGYIEGAYKLAAEAVRTNEPVLANVIDEHSPAAAAAWSKWIASEPRVAELLRRMMVGTPLGEVIGVHVSIVFSYTLARSASRHLAEAALRAEQPPAAAEPAAV